MVEGIDKSQNAIRAILLNLSHKSMKSLMSNKPQEDNHTSITLSNLHVNKQ